MCWEWEEVGGEGNKEVIMGYEVFGEKESVYEVKKEGGWGLNGE